MTERTASRRGQFEGPALFSHGFRPFFLGAAIFGGLAIPIWLAMIWGRIVPESDIVDPVFWHAHEMIFGYLAAVVAGFLLTAVPNWTGRLPVIGRPLAWLFLLWFCGRVGMAMAAGNFLAPDLAKIIDCSFLIVLALVMGREIFAGRNWRNIPVIVLLSLMAVANIAMNFAREFGIERAFGERFALGTATVMIALIGGRIIPSFTRNWLSSNGHVKLPAGFGGFDKATVASTAIAAVCWLLLPKSSLSGVVLLFAGLMNCVRLSRWRGLATFLEPLVFILHVGYAWLCVALLLLGAEILFPGAVPQGAALHALTTGAIGTMTLAVMTRASLGHTGRVLASTAGIDAIYICVNLGAGARVLAPWFGTSYAGLLTVGGTLWAMAFVAFAIIFGPMLTAPRQARTANS